MKDYAMAYYIAKLMRGTAITADETAGGVDEDQYFVLAGKGHLAHGTGVPEILERFLRDGKGARWGSSSFSAADTQEQGQQAVVATDPWATVVSEMMYNLDIDEWEDKSDSTKLERLICENDLVRDMMLLGKETGSSTNPPFQPSEGPPGGNVANTGGQWWNDSSTRNNASDLFQSPAGDFVFVYDEDDESPPIDCHPDDVALEGLSTELDEMARRQAAKLETRTAYDKVGETANITGNVQKARAIMKHLGYADADIEIIGEKDLANYQGVGNPFRFANIQKGERVLDLGSGLGVDSFLAAHRTLSPTTTASGGNGDTAPPATTAPTPLVTGVDLSRKQVQHATIRAQERYGVTNSVSSAPSPSSSSSSSNFPVQFFEADIERLSDSAFLQNKKKS